MDDKTSDDHAAAANEEQLLWLNKYGPGRKPKRVRGPTIPHDDNRSGRVGWIDSPRKLICYACYEIGHVIADCKCGITDMPKVVANYEALSPDDKASVPDTYYRKALCFVKGRPENALWDEVDKATQSKN